MRLVHRRSRAAVSELMASLIMIAITLVAGAAVFSYVNGQEASSSAAVGNSAGKNINFLNEREVVVYAAMVSSSVANIWVYNSGLISPENMTNVVVYDLASPAQLCTVSLHGEAAALINKTQVSSAITVTLPSSSTSSCPFPNGSSYPFQFLSGHSYDFEVIGLFGSTAEIRVAF